MINKLLSSFKKSEMKLKDLEDVSVIYDKIKEIDLDIGALKNSAEGLLDEKYEMLISLSITDLDKKSESAPVKDPYQMTYSSTYGGFIVTTSSSSAGDNKVNLNIREIDKLRLIEFLIGLKNQEKQELINKLNIKYKIK